MSVVYRVFAIGTLITRLSLGYILRVRYKSQFERTRRNHTGVYLSIEIQLKFGIRIGNLVPKQRGFGIQDLRVVQGYFEGRIR